MKNKSMANISNYFPNLQIHPMSGLVKPSPFTFKPIKIKKQRLKRARWPKAVCTECGSLRWRGSSSLMVMFTCAKKHCRGTCWKIPNLTLGFELASLSRDKRATFAKLNAMKERLT